jgi:hypothetical protein
MWSYFLGFMAKNLMSQGVGCWFIGFENYFSSTTLSHPQIKTFNTMWKLTTSCNIKACGRTIFNWLEIFKNLEMCHSLKKVVLLSVSSFDPFWATIV